MVVRLDVSWKMLHSVAEEVSNKHLPYFIVMFLLLFALGLGSSQSMSTAMR